MVREVVKSLDGVLGRGVKGDAVLGGGEQILHGVDGGFVVFMAGVTVVGRQKGKGRRYVGSGARC